MPRIIKLFLSSPSDVVTEQDAIKSLIAEVNDVIIFLAPHLDVKLEVIHYATDVFPDAGSPQDVVDRQIPDDYDIHLGIMWKRCGTPTGDAKSGTIHEFNQAIERRAKTGKPVIMFYFSDEPPPTLFRTVEELEQLKSVIEFRDDMQTKCLTVSYPDAASFRERARVQLLRAIANITNEKPQKTAARLKVAAAREDAIPEKIKKLASDYDKLRMTMKSGWERTRQMQGLFDAMVAQAPSAISALSRLKASKSDGERLAAIAVLSAFPRTVHLDWLAQRLDPDLEKPFVGYQASGALAQAVQTLMPNAQKKLASSLSKAGKLAALNQDDPARIKVLENAMKDLARRVANK